MEANLLVRTVHPQEVVHLEHDGKVFLVDDSGAGPQRPEQGRIEFDTLLRFPTVLELERLNIPYSIKDRCILKWGTEHYVVLKAYPSIPWPEQWAWKDEVIADNAVHPVAREAVYRSLHRLVSKVIIQNPKGQILMAKIERGHFRGHWSLPGGYMDHNEHPEVGALREVLEEVGLSLSLTGSPPHITQKVFNEEGVSFVSFTYQASWDGELSALRLLEEEISEAKWFHPEEALNNAVSHFDREAILALD